MKEEGKTNAHSSVRITNIKAKDTERSLTPEERERILAMRRRKEATLKEQKTQAKLVIASFIVGVLLLAAVILIFAVKWPWLPILGIGLGLIGLILLIVLISKAAKCKKMPAKSGLFFISCILIVAGLVISVIAGVVQATSSQGNDQEKTSLEEVDVNGMTISAACDAVREKKWIVLEVVDENDSTNKSTCSDTQHRVSSSRYYNLTSSVNAGKVVLYFTGDSQSSSAASKAQSAETDEIDYSFRNTMKEYEAFVDEYVIVIRQHKADPSNPEIVAKYNAMTMQYNEWVNKINAIDTSKLSKTDLAYYNEVVNRVNKKISDANNS